MYTHIEKLSSVIVFLHVTLTEVNQGNTGGGKREGDCLQNTFPSLLPFHYPNVTTLLAVPTSPLLSSTYFVIGLLISLPPSASLLPSEHLAYAHTVVRTSPIIFLCSNNNQPLIYTRFPVSQNRYQRK